MQGSGGKASAKAKNSARSKSKSDSDGASKRHTYLEMVQVALLTLNERGGSSR